MTKTVLPVTIEVSAPYTLIGFGRGGHYGPLGTRRTYTANVDGVTFRDESKAHVQTVIRQHVYRQHGDAVRVQFTFASAGVSA